MLLQTFEFVRANSDVILAGLFLVWGLAEFVVRLTPTKKDDTALERVGKVLKSGMDALGIPNRRVQETVIQGTVMKPVDEEATQKIELPGGKS